MPRSTKRGRPAGASSEETHDRIIVAARGVFAERGYAATQNRVVAERADVTASALYHYFDSKLDLYTAVFEQAESWVADRYRAAVEGSEGPKQAIASVLEAARALYREDPSVPTFLAGVPIEMRNDPDVSAAIARCEVTTAAVLLDVFERASAAGQLGPNATPTGLAAVLFACTTGIALFAQTPMGFTYDQMLDAFAQLCSETAF